jgi:hypothetical protein
MIYLPNYNINNDLIKKYGIDEKSTLLDNTNRIKYDNDWINKFKLVNNINLNWKTFGYDDITNVYDRIEFLGTDYPIDVINEIFSSINPQKIFINMNINVIYVCFNRIHMVNKYWIIEFMEAWKQFKFFSYCENIIFFTRKINIDSLFKEYDIIKNSELYDKDLSMTKLLITGIPSILLFENNEILGNDEIEIKLINIIKNNHNSKYLIDENIEQIFIIKPKENVNKFRQYNAILKLNINNKKIINEILNTNIQYLNYNLKFERHLSKYDKLIEEEPLLQFIQQCQKCHRIGHTNKYCDFMNNWTKNETEK